MHGRAITVALFTLIEYSSGMRLVLQRVKSASVMVEHEVVASIEKGILALVGLHEDDTAEDLRYCARKLCASKLWANESDKSWRKSVKQLNYEVLLVSQFTLCGDVDSKKHVPDFKRSMKSDRALDAFNEFSTLVAVDYGDADKIKHGVFGASMDVALVNDGPVTFVVDSRNS